MPKTKLQWALECAGKGWKVFPLAVNSKVPPSGVKWREVATTKEPPIKAWWNVYPDCNIGIMTGKKSNLTVLDIDKPEEWYAWIDHNDSIEGPPATYWVNTPNGEHAYFTYEPNSANKVKGKCFSIPGCDVRSEGGYVVGPGSAINGVQYSLDSDLPVAEPPNWLVSALTTPLTSTTMPSVTRLDHGAVEGGRNHHLSAIAGHMQQKGYLTEHALQAINLEECTPPLPEKEVSTIAASIGRYDITRPFSADKHIEATLAKPATKVFLTIQEIKSQVIASLKDKVTIRGTSTGMPGLDKLLGGGFRTGEFVALHAESGTGKSSLVHQWITSLLQQGIPVGYASREMRPHDEVVPNMLSIVHKENAWLVEINKDREDSYGADIDKWPLYFTPGYGPYSASKLKVWVHELKPRGVLHFFIDHLHYCLDDPEDYAKVVVLAQQLKKLANEEKICIICIIQPTKIYEGQRLSKNTLRGGAGLNQAIDTLIMLERYTSLITQKKSDRYSVLTVDKGRHKIVKPGSLFLEYDHATTCMFEVERIVHELDEETLSEIV